MAADGSIVIETKLDTDGIDRGLKEIKAAIESRMGDAENSVNRVMEAIARAVGNTDAASGAERIVSAIAGAFIDGAGDIAAAAASAASAAADRFGAGTGEFASGGAALGSAAAAGISGRAGEIASAASSAASGGASAAAGTQGQFSSVGSNLMSALRAGIAAGASALYAKAASIASAVVAKFKGIFSIHSPSRVFRDDIGKMLMLGLRDGIMNNSELVLEAVKDLSSDMLESEKRYLEEKERIEKEQAEADEAKRVREYEERLAAASDLNDREKIIADERLRLKKKADDAYLAQLKESSQREREIVDSLKDDITAVYKEIAEYVENSLEPIADSRDALSDRLKSYAEESTGYREHSFRYRVEEPTSIGALRRYEAEERFYTLMPQKESIETLRRYGEALENVSERLKESFSPETARSFMNTLAGMNVDEGVIFAETLSKAGIDEFTEYIEQWSEKNELAEAIANQFYSGEFTEAVDDCTEYMRSELEALGLEVPEGFFASGSASAEQFGRGFAEGLNEVLEDARGLIESFGGFAADVLGTGEASVVTNNNYYSSYSINGTRSTAAESIHAAETAAVMNKYRGLG